MHPLGIIINYYYHRPTYVGNITIGTKHIDTMPIQFYYFPFTLFILRYVILHYNKSQEIKPEIDTSRLNLSSYII